MRHCTSLTSSAFSALGLSYSKESNTYGRRASNYGKLLGCPAQGVCLFFTTDAHQTVFWEVNKAVAQCLSQGTSKGKLQSPSLWSIMPKLYKFEVVHAVPRYLCAVFGLMN